jgi:hypothetical protein
MTSTDPQDSNGGNSGPNSINGTEGRISSGYSINGILGIQHSNDPNVNTMKRKRVDDHGELSSGENGTEKRNGRKTHAFPARVPRKMKNMETSFSPNFSLFSESDGKRQFYCCCNCFRCSIECCPLRLSYTGKRARSLFFF